MLTASHQLSSGTPREELGKGLKELKAFTTPWEEQGLPGTTPSTKKGHMEAPVAPDA